MGEKISFELRGEFIFIPSLGFYMPYHRSENGRFILAWQDACIANGKTITGNFILIDKDEIILEGETERPCNGKVSNKGIFIINDRISFEGRMGTFFVLEADGRILIEKKFNAHLDCNGLSNDGNFAVCQICRSGKDSNKLFFFDVLKQELKWNCIPEFGNANSFCFDTENRVLFLNYNNDKCYRYNFDGLFLDSN